MVIPNKLKPGDEVRIVAPSLSLDIISDEQLDIATKRLAAHGLRVSYGDHARERDIFDSSSVVSRIADLHAAFADDAVKGIFSIIGGANANQLLDHLDYDLIAANPKVFCGYSDITILQNAIFTKTGLVSYSGPHFSTFGMLKGYEYTDEYFQKCLMQPDPFIVAQSPEWSDDEWYLNQTDRTFIPSTGWQVIQPGEATGVALGGNLCTFSLLQGTQYMPSLDDAILFFEDDSLSSIEHVDRYLQSLTQQPGWRGVRGIVFGRFQKQSNVSVEMLREVVVRKPALRGLPIAADLDFGHTSPMFTFPVGGEVRIDFTGEAPVLEIVRH